MLLFLSRGSLGILGNRDNIATYSGWFVEYVLYGKNDRLELVLKSEKQVVLESDVFKINEINGKVYIYGYSGYTVVNRYTNEVTQLRRNWGNAALSVAARPEELSAIPLIIYKQVDKFEDFSVDDKIGFKSFSHDLMDIKLSKNPYREKQLTDIVRLIEIKPNKKIQVVETQKGSLIEPNLRSVREIDGKIYLLGDRSMTIINAQTGRIEQLVVSKISDGLEIRELISFRAKDYGERYKQLDQFEDFLKKDQEIFLELKENSEKYRPKF